MDMNTNQLAKVAFDKAAYATKQYSSKLPSSVNDVLWKFSGNYCLAVKRLGETLGLNQSEGNCHLNVLEHVAAYGGKMVNGWLLAKNSRLNKCGVWLWSFHSVWQTDDGLLVDVTKDDLYKGEKRTIFLRDNARRFYPSEGISHNNIVVFENWRISKHFSENVKTSLRPNKVYWTNENLAIVKPLEEHTGQYRLLKGYPKNQQLLVEQYGAVVNAASKSSKPMEFECLKNLLLDFDVEHLM